MDALGIFRQKKQGQMLLLAFLASWGGLTALGMLVKTLADGAQAALMMLPTMAGFCVFGAMIGVVVYDLYYKSVLDRQIQDLLQALGEFYDFKRLPGATGITGELDGCTVSIVWNWKFQRVGQRAVGAVTTKFEGPLENLTISPADGQSAGDRLPGTDNFLSVKGDYQLFSARLEDGQRKRLYQLVVEEEWEVSPGYIFHAVHPVLWEVEELEQAILQGQELVAILHRPNGQAVPDPSSVTLPEAAAQKSKPPSSTVVLPNG